MNNNKKYEEVPFSVTDLIEKDIKKDTEIWCDRLSYWIIKKW
jgi:hypothetical protein